MDCNYTTIKTCELKGSTFRSHVLNFGDFDISNIEFTADFGNSLGQKIITQPIEKYGNTLVLSLTPIENRSGRFRSDVWMLEDGIRDLAVRFDISISDADCGCTDDTTHDITITFQELVIPVTVTQSVVNINLDYESLTPEQQADLRFDWEDFTPENIAELQQPAIQAATLANTATQNANEATEAAQVATEEAQTATTAANEATADATTATNNANQAAGFATSATQEAATATGEATAASSSANSAATAANAGAANAEAKAILADTAASNAQAKATLADSAAANANDKAGIAQTAATNADQKAALADTATTNANTATNAANAAAATANAARGWQPLLTADTTTIAGKTLLKLSDWIGGTGTKPTTNVGQWQKADGTYTDVASEANNIKGEDGLSNMSLVASYTHSTNKEVYVTAVDYDTNSFTANNHDLTNGTGISIFFNQDINKDVFNNIPLSSFNREVIYYVIDATTNTFRISTTNGGASVTLTNSANINLSTWHFEVVSQNIALFTDIGVLENVRVDISLRMYGRADLFLRNTYGGNILGSGKTLITTSSTSNANSGILGSVGINTNYKAFGNYTLDIFAKENYSIADMKMIYLGLNDSAQKELFSISNRFITERKIVFNNYMRIISWAFGNGTTIKIYKL